LAAQVAEVFHRNYTRTMNRRGFFSQLFGSDDEALFFGMQVVVDTHRDDPLRAALHAKVAQSPATTAPEQKIALYKSIVTLLLENAPFFEYGYWDYIPDSPDARAEFDTWRSDIEGGAATEADETGDAVDELYRMSSDKSFVVVTMFFLFTDSDAVDTLHSTIESIAEDELFRRETFLMLIKAIRFLNFEHCLGDAVYLMPANDKDGFSWEDLHGGGWEYLRSLA